MDFTARELPTDTYVTIMDQYHPCCKGAGQPPLSREHCSPFSKFRPCASGELTTMPATPLKGFINSHKTPHDFYIKNIYILLTNMLFRMIMKTKGLLFENCSGVCVNAQLRNLSTQKKWILDSNVVSKPSSEKDA
jgi:hypothetical protein